MMIAGRDAVDKAKAVGKAILARSRRLMRDAGFGDFTRNLAGGARRRGELRRAEPGRRRARWC